MELFDCKEIIIEPIVLQNDTPFSFDRKREYHSLYTYHPKIILFDYKKHSGNFLTASFVWLEFNLRELYDSINI